MVAPGNAESTPRSRHARLRALQVTGEGAWPLSRDDAASMRPLLEGGETVFWREAGKADARAGDLLLYGFVAGPARAQTAGRQIDPVGSVREALQGVPLILAVHRVVRRDASTDEKRFVTKGDARPANDVEAIPLEDVIGVVFAFEREGVRWSLEGPGARFYARLAWFTSRCFAGLYRAGAIVDALLRRMLFGRVDVFVFRPILAGIQRAKHGFFHVLLFRACHRGEPAAPPAPR